MAMRDNLQREYYEEVNQNVQPQQRPYIQTVPQAKPKEKTKGWTFVQKATVTVLSVCVTGLCVLTISVSNQLQSTNRNVQDIATQISQLEVENNDLEQSISELSRYDRIYDIAKSHGLELNDQNVRNVTK